MPNGKPNSQIPCALRSHLRIDSGGRHSQLANLSQSECEIVFLHWVVTERNLSPYLSPTERLTCPVLWCGINFDNDESLLCHLKDCPHLPASCYWCPRCHRAESFADYKIPVPLQKKPSRLKTLIHKHFSRKRASGPSQHPTMKPELYPVELYSHPTDKIDGQGLHEHYDPSGFEFELDAPVGTWKQQNNTLGSPDRLSTNIALFEMDSMTQRVEKDGDMIMELTGNTSFPEPNQFNEPPDQSDPVLDFLVADIDDLIQQSGDHICQATFPKPARQSQTDGRNPASGIFDPQDILFVDCRALQPRHSGYDPSHTPCANPEHAPRSTPPVYALPHTQNLAYSAIDPTLDTTNFLADGQKVRQGQPNPETGPVNSPLGASYNQTNSTGSMSAGSSTRFPTHSSYGPSYTPNLAEVQNSWYLPASPDHAPRSATSDYDLLHTQDLAQISIKPTINTINVPPGGQKVRQGHPNPETGPVNSPLAAICNQTNSTGSMSAGSSTSLPTHSSYDPSYTPNLGEVQNSWYRPASPDHVPRSATSEYDLLHTQNWAHNKIKPTINTINVPAGGQKVRQGHPNPETGPVNSPRSASSNQTSTTWSKESTGTVLTPLTTFSDPDSPTGLSPRNVSESSAQSSGNPRFTCKPCKLTFNDASNFRRHEKNQHGEVSLIPCGGCGRKFNRRDNLKRHYKNSCKRERHETP